MIFNNMCIKSDLRFSYVIWKYFYYKSFQT